MAIEFVKPVQEDERNAIKQKTAAVLPNSPADHGMKAGAVKPKFWQALTQGEKSVAGLIDRVVGDVNRSFEQANEALDKRVLGFSYDLDTAQFTLTFGDGSTEVLQGPAKGEKGDTGETGAQGPTGPQGPKGDGLSFSKIYGSVAEMNEGFATDGVGAGQFVLITTEDVNNEENSRFYVKTEAGYVFVNDLSGAQGIQGPQGPQGPQGEKGDKGADGATWALRLTAPGVAMVSGGGISISAASSYIRAAKSTKVMILSSENSITYAQEAVFPPYGTWGGTNGMLTYIPSLYIGGTMLTNVGVRITPNVLYLTGTDDLVTLSKATYAIYTLT